MKKRESPYTHIKHICFVVSIAVYLFIWLWDVLKMGKPFDSTLFCQGLGSLLGFYGIACLRKI